MSISELASIGEFVGGIGVLATLVFLVLEIRRSTKTLRANAKTAGMESLATFNELIASDAEIAAIFQRILSGESLNSFDANELFRFHIMVRALVQRMEAQYFQYVEGLIEPGYWKQRRSWLKSFVDSPALRDWWLAEANSAQYTEEFVLHINSTQQRCQIGPEGQLQGDA